MDLSIIFVNWNSKDFLAEAIDSVYERTTGIDFEIIVIDSGSYDGCADMLRVRYPKVKFFQSEANLGFAKANNEAVARSTGRVLLFLNPDTEIKGTAITTLYRHYEYFGKPALLGPKLLNSDGSVQETCVRAIPTILNQLFESNALRSSFPQSSLWGKQALDIHKDEIRPVQAVSGACMMIERSLFDAVGMFCTDYFMYSEDMDLCLRVQRAGFGVYYVPAAVVVHHGGASSAKTPSSTFSAVMAFESRWRFFRRNRSRWYAGLYRAAMFGASLCRLGLLWVASPLHALRDASDSKNRRNKWIARLRWTLGRETWVRNY